MGSSGRTVQTRARGKGQLCTDYISKLSYCRRQHGTLQTRGMDQGSRLTDQISPNCAHAVVHQISGKENEKIHSIYIIHTACIQTHPFHHGSGRI